MLSQRTLNRKHFVYTIIIFVVHPINCLCKPLRAWARVDVCHLSDTHPGDIQPPTLAVSKGANDPSDHFSEYLLSQSTQS